MSKRLDFIVYLRCMALFLVVVGHALCTYSPFWKMHVSPIDNSIWYNTVRIIYLIHMPIFSLISGYIYFCIRQNGGYNSTKMFVLKKLKRLFVPLLIFGFFECSIDLDGDYSHILSGPLHLWYLNFLLKCFFITYVYDKLLLKYSWMVFPLIIVLILGYQLFSNVLRDDHFFQLYPYFLLGIAIQTIINKGIIKNTPPHRRWIYACLLFSIVLFGATFRLKIHPGLFALLFNFLLFLSFSITSFPPVPNMLNNIDKCSMGIYLIHHPIIWNFVSTGTGRRYLIEYPYITPLLLGVISFFISWLITFLLLKTKYFKYILG